MRGQFGTSLPSLTVLMAALLLHGCSSDGTDASPLPTADSGDPTFGATPDSGRRDGGPPRPGEGGAPDNPFGQQDGGGDIRRDGGLLDAMPDGFLPERDGGFRADGGFPPPDGGPPPPRDGGPLQDGGGPFGSRDGGT